MRARDKQTGHRRLDAATLFLLLAIGMLVTSLLALDLGATDTGLGNLPGLLDLAWSRRAPSPDEEIGLLVLSGIRLPRLALGLATGAALGASGAVMQGLFRNQLADPGLVGVSAGAALATAIVIVLGGGALAPLLEPLGRWAQPLAGLLGALLGTAILYALATREGVTSIATVLLGGIALAAFCAAFTGLLVYMADDRALRDLSFWTLGSLSGASWTGIGAALPFLGIGALCICFLASSLNALLLGEADAFHLGADVQRAKHLALLGVAALTGAAVASVGIIGFVGVLVPNLVRLLVGPDHRLVLPASAMLGGMLLVLSDTLARTIAAPAEVPVGIITALLGAPVFLWLLLRDGGRMARL
ncbi:FecCD family ABC transporter permease [Novosphingobium sp. M1R2S20]|uniref:FecCD family ABC transporter permease n=1 Tax=Novosphingobium rhizovicinum TaxID=3228928 RepID=A0ABV3R9Q8_9SPHN